MDAIRSRYRILSYLLKVALVAAAYFGSAQIGLALSAVHGSVSLLWPPTGLALAIILLYGQKFWSGILLGAFLANWLTNGPLSFSIIAGIGNTLEALVGAYLLQRFSHFHNAVDRVGDVTGLVFLAAGLSTVVSATLGVLGLCLSGRVPWGEFGSVWLIWWLGDAIGALVIAPLLLIWGTQRRLNSDPRQLIEGGLWLTSLSVVSWLAFGRLLNSAADFSLAYLPFPVLMFAALRFGQRTTVTGTLVVSGIAVWGTLNGLGPFARQSVNDTHLFLWAFMSVVAVTPMFLAATVTERKQADEALAKERNLLRTVIDFLPDNIFVKDRNSRFLLNNAMSMRLLGVSRQEDLLGKTDFDLFPIEVAKPWFDREQTVMKSGQPLLGKADFHPWLEHERHWILVSQIPLRGKHGEVIGLVGRESDITELKQVEDRERAIARSLRGVVAAADELIATENLDTFYQRAVEMAREKLKVERCGILLFDPTHQYLMGTYGTDDHGRTTNEHALQTPVSEKDLELLSGSSDPWIVGQMDRTFWNGEQVQKVGFGWNATTLLRIGGEPIGIFSNDTAITEAPLDPIQQEAIVLYCSLLGNILEHKRAEETLRESERRFRALLESAPDAMVIANSEGKIVLVNSQTERLFGYGRAELLGQAVEMLIPLPFRSQHVSYRADYTANPHVRGRGMASELYALRKDGNQFPVDISLSPIETEAGTLIASVIADITERKRAEEALRTSEKIHKDLFLEVERQAQELALLDRVRTALAGELDLSTVYRTVVEVVAKTYGYPQVSIYKIEGDESVLQHQVGYSTVIERVPIAAGISGRVIRSGQPVLIEDVQSDPDFLAAMEGLTSEICVPLLDQGRAVGFFNIESTDEIRPTQADLRLMTALSQHINIAIERARLYTEAREKEAWFRLLFDLAPIGMTVVGPDGRFQRVNRAFGALLGYTPEELIGQKFADLTYPDDVQSNLSIFEQLLKGEIPDYQLEKRYITRTGNLVTVILGLAPLRDAQGHPLQVIGQALDITERKLAEQRTLELAAEKQRVQVLNEFIRDISHEFRTPLATINACVYILKKITEPQTQQEATERIAKQVKHLTQVLEQILTMSQLGSTESLPSETVIVNDLVKGVVPDIASLVDSKHLTVTLNLDETVAEIQADREQLPLAISNIAENGARYTPEGGTITLQTRRSGSTVVIEVIDTGIGITDEALPHVFERLYRADKARTIRDTGVGLGLSIAKRIVELHHGKIEVESTPGQGSTFRIILPIKVIANSVTKS